MEVYYGRKNGTGKNPGAGASDFCAAHWVYFKKDHPREDALLPSVDGKRETARQVSAGGRNGAPKGTNRTPQSPTSGVKELAGRHAEAAADEAGF